ncbi:M1 family metallopeptidase [Actinocrispum sp. NPDC049592]|uniref:M1 family metallopeptidase n=1 Tax=Actinocrispum sp. NPDC049592 TaxID=3154835 RepID=UPI00344A1240
MFQRSRLALAAGAAGIATVLFGSLAAAAPAPGAPGAGDPYYPNAGNGGYDVSHYNIRLTYNPATDLLSGTTTISAKTTQELSSFDLDFLLPIKSIRVNNLPAQTRTAAVGEVVVTPPRPLANGADLTVVVQYEGTPSTVKDATGFTAWKKTPTTTLAVDEPDIAPWWFPSSNHPTDKATFDVSVAVPNGTEVISNGTFAGTTPQINGWTRWNWRSLKPQATYLTYIVIGQFEIRTQPAPNGQPIVTAYGEDLGDNAESARASIERTGEIIEFESSVFGDYPFEAQGGVASTGLNFALENQTRPVYSDRFFRRGANTSVISHELAHQWFGDSVSVQTWRNIWLNEGFATYAQYLWSEHENEGTAAEVAQYWYDFYPANDPFWQFVVAEPGSGNEFNGAVYDRGGITLQALRTKIGDDAFFTLLKTWTAQHRYGNATIEQFIALAEKISGKPLFDFFQTWLFTKGKPAEGPNGPAPAGLSAKAAHAKPKSIDQIQYTHEILAQQH